MENLLQYVSSLEMSTVLPFILKKDENNEWYIDGINIAQYNQRGLSRAMYKRSGGMQTLKIKSGPADYAQYNYNDNRYYL